MTPFRTTTVLQPAIFWRDISGLEMVVEFAEFFPAKSGYLWVNWHQRACTLGSLREAIMASKTKSVAEVERFSMLWACADGSPARWPVASLVKHRR